MRRVVLVLERGRELVERHCEHVARRGAPTRALPRQKVNRVAKGQVVASVHARVAWHLHAHVGAHACGPRRAAQCRAHARRVLNANGKVLVRHVELGNVRAVQAMVNRFDEALVIRCHRAEINGVDAVQVKLGVGNEVHIDAREVYHQRHGIVSNDVGQADRRHVDKGAQR